MFSFTNWIIPYVDKEKQLVSKRSSSIFIRLGGQNFEQQYVNRDGNDNLKNETGRLYCNSDATLLSVK